MGHYSHLFIFLFQYSLLLVLIIAPTDAQSPFTPENTYGSVSVYTEGVAFYVQAGHVNSNTSLTQQTFSIDLSVSWKISSPAYTKLTDGISDAWFPNVLLNDNVSWAAISNKTLVTYNLKTGVSSAVSPFSTTDSLEGTGAFVDLGTGDFVVPSLTSPSAPNPIYRSSNLNITFAARPTSTQLGGLRYYAIAWSTSQQAAFAFGGRSAGGQHSATLMRLNRQSSTWRPILAEGGPSARIDACMVAIEGGNRLVVFGGQTFNLIVLNDIYIYDVLASKWTKGSNGGPRSGHVCAASFGKLIAWGGYSIINNASMPILASVYDVTMNTWQEQYVPSLSTSPTPSSTPVATIAGGCAGAVAVLAILVFLMVRRRAAKKLARSPLPVQAKSSSIGKDALLPGTTTNTKTTTPVHNPQLRWPEGTIDSHISEHRSHAPQEQGSAADSRNPQYAPASHTADHQGPPKAPEDDHLRQMQLEERLALEQLIETQRAQMEKQQEQMKTQHEQMEAQNRRLQLLIEQRRSYQAELGEEHSPQVTDVVSPSKVRNPQLI